MKKKPSPEQLISKHLDIWTTAIEQKSSAGRGSSKKFSLYGIKKLRELILELAVRGKLVPQDSNDEPAAVLLERIAAEKIQLVQDKKIKKPKALPEIGDDEKPLRLPKGWEYKRLPDVYYPISPSGKKLKSSEISNEGKFPVVDQGQEYVAGYSDNIDLLISIEHPIIVFGDHTRNIKLVDFDFIAGADGTKILCPICIFPKYFYFYLTSYDLESRGYGRHFKILNDNLISIPPLEEQHRIVAKVDELMSLCDALEAQTEASITAHQTLVTVLLDALLIPKTGKDSLETLDSPEPIESFAQNWQRLHEHFDTLFTTVASIEALKQTILQLAVMGKLVKQDPNDEPAAKLLARIASEKAQLITDNKIKKQKALPPILDEEKPFALPEGWEWSRFEDLVDIQGGITKGRKLSGRELITVKYLSVANVQRSYLDLSYLKEVDIPIEERGKYQVKARDLLITEGGDWDKVGRTAIWSNEMQYMAHQNHVFKARIFLEEQSEIWLEKYLNGPYARDYFAGSSKQTTNLASINKTQLRGCIIAIPPAEEKYKIVAKVNQLMEICDQLKTCLSEAQQTQLHLTDAIVEQEIQ